MLEKLLKKLEKIDRKIKNESNKNDDDYLESTYDAFFQVEYDINKHFFEITKSSQEQYEKVIKKHTEIGISLKGADYFQFYFRRYIFNQNQALDFLKDYVNLNRSDSKAIINFLRKYDYGKAFRDKVFINTENFYQTGKKLSELAPYLYHDENGSFNEKFPGAKNHLLDLIDKVAAKTILFQLLPNDLRKIEGVFAEAERYQEELNKLKTDNPGKYQHALKVIGRKKSLNSSIEEFKQSLSSLEKDFAQKENLQELIQINITDELNTITKYSYFDTAKVQYMSTPFSSYHSLEQDKVKFWLGKHILDQDFSDFTNVADASIGVEYYKFLENFLVGENGQNVSFDAKLKSFTESIDWTGEIDYPGLDNSFALQVPNSIVKNHSQNLTKLFHSIYNFRNFMEVVSTKIKFSTEEKKEAFQSFYKKHSAEIQRLKNKVASLFLMPLTKNITWSKLDDEKLCENEERLDNLIKEIERNKSSIFYKVLNIIFFTSQPDYSNDLNNVKKTIDSLRLKRSISLEKFDIEEQLNSNFYHTFIDELQKIETQAKEYKGSDKKNSKVLFEINQLSSLTEMLYSDEFYEIVLDICADNVENTSFLNFIDQLKEYDEYSDQVEVVRNNINREGYPDSFDNGETSVKSDDETIDAKNTDDASSSSSAEQSYQTEDSDVEKGDGDEADSGITPEIDFPHRSIKDLGNIEEVPLYPESEYIKDPTDIYEDLSHEEVLEAEDPKETLKRLEKERRKKVEESNPNELEVMPPQIDDEENSSKAVSKRHNQSSQKTALEQAAAWFGNEKNQQSMAAGATVGGFIALGMKVGKNVMQHYSSKHSLQQTASRSALKSSMLNQNQSFSSKNNVKYQKYQKGSFGSAQKSQGAKTYRQPTRGRMGSNGKTMNKFTTGNKVKGPNSYKTANIKNNILDYNGNKKASKISTKALKNSGGSSFSRTGYSLHGGASSGYVPTSASGQPLTKN